MTPSELHAKISALKQAANGLEEPEKSLRLDEVAVLEKAIDDMALNEVVNKLVRINLPSQHEMDDLIAKASTATRDQQARVRCFDTALGRLRIALGIAA